MKKDSFFLDYTNKMKHSLCNFSILLLLFFLIPLPVNAKGEIETPQQSPILEIKGLVTSKEKEPLTGVTISIKGTGDGTITGLDGDFTLKARKEAILVFSYVGYKSREITVKSNDFLNIVLEDDMELLDEVVVVGYGTLDRREVTSSIKSIKSDDILTGPSSSPLEAIRGKVSNLSIVSNNGSDPNSGVSIQLRGANSILAGQGPLIIVDGIPGGNLNEIQKEDIESIDVLKDASAAAIYGTRGSGGVILVTTKKAKTGKVSATYSTELTVETVRKKADVLSAEEYLKNREGVTDYGERIDWFDEVTRSAPFSHRHVISLTGGTETLKTYTSIYYKKANALAIDSDRREVGGRFNFTYSLFENRLNFVGNVSYADIRANRSPNSMFMMALKLNPTIPVYDSNSTSGYNVITGGWEEWNPVADSKLMTDRSDYRNLMASLTTQLKITPYLNTSLTIATKNNDERYIYWRSAQHKASQDANVRGFAKMENKKWNDVSLDWLFDFNKSFGDHNLKAVGGYSFQEFNYDGFYAENQDFPVDGVQWWDMNSGSYLTEGRANLGSYKNPKERLIAFLGRINYSYKDKYMATLSGRYEGISKLSPDNRWGFFPSISAGWRISSEEFMKPLSWLNDLTIRVGYGVTGNADFGTGVGTRMYSADAWWLANGSWFKTYGLAHNVNKDLKWEKKKEWNVGVDFSTLNHRLSGKVDVYKRKVDNMIYDISVPQPPAVHDKMTMNSGNLENTGFEFELSGVVVDTKDWNYTTTIVGSHNKTKLKSLWGSQTYWDRKGFEAPGSPGTAVRLIAGENIGRFYIWKYAGIDDDGNWLLYNKDNEVIPAKDKSQDDKRFIGNAIPKVILSWQNNIRYKNFDASIFFRSWIGHDVFNKINMYYGLSNVENTNVLKDAYKKNKHIVGEKELCDYWVEKGTFLKLDALTVGYTFTVPAIDKYVKNIRASFTARDLFCITSYSGMNPEVNINGLDPGFEERDVYPQSRSFTLGLQINF